MQNILKFCMLLRVFMHNFCCLMKYVWGYSLCNLKYRTFFKILSLFVKVNKPVLSSVRKSQF